MNRRDIRRILAVTALFVLAVTPLHAGKIYFSDADQIWRVNQNGTNEELILDHVLNVRDVAVDPGGAKLYWAQLDGGVVRSDLDGSNVENLGVADRASVLALDLPAGKVYWSDTSTDEIERADLDGSNAELIVTYSTVSGIAVDPIGEKIYWTSYVPPYGEYNDTIVRSNLDGSNIQVVVSDAFAPGAIALDVAAGKMYWAEFGPNTVRRANLNGTARETILTGVLPDDIDVDAVAGKIYWNGSGPIGDHIKRANLDGSQVELMIQSLHSNTKGLGLALSLNCGDGVVDLFEDCDDGNNVDGDGCQAGCEFPACGDGVTDTGEECDDDQLDNCDGCDDQCIVEVGWICGDGVLNTTCGEECDDGNDVDGDGCQADCRIAVCGDGVVDDGEECDDDNTRDGDGCQGNCMNPYCGDGIWDFADEECDDGNSVDGDGCHDCVFTHLFLYDQLETVAGNGAPDQAFSQVYAAYDSEAADDFEVTNSEGWDIEVLVTRGFRTVSGLQPIFVKVEFYPDDGGLPGSVAECAWNVEDAVFSNGYYSGQMLVPLPATCRLESGRWWVVQQVRQDLAVSGQYFWSARDEQSYSEYVWRNPGNGFGLGCVDWTPVSDCFSGGGPPSPDLLFALLGAESGSGSGGGSGGGDGPDPVPAVGPFGMLILAAGLFGSASYILRRGRRED